MSKSNAINLELLPKTLREIAELIGVADTLKLIKSYGGTRVYFHEKLEDNEWLNDTIAKSKAKLLWERFKKEQVMIDKAEKALLDLRKQEIIAKLATHTRAQLAIDYNVTETTIYNYQKEYLNKDQMELDL